MTAASTEQVAGTWRGSSLEDFAGDLQRLAEKAYPDLDGGQRERFVRNQFIQGLLSSTAQLLLLKEMPQSVDDALRLAKKQHTVEEAQRRLRQRKHGGDVEAVVAVDSEETGDTTIRQQRSRVLNRVHCSSRFDTVRRRWPNYKYRQEVGVHKSSVVEKGTSRGTQLHKKETSMERTAE